MLWSRQPWLCFAFTTSLHSVPKTDFTEQAAGIDLISS